MNYRSGLTAIIAGILFLANSNMSYSQDSAAKRVIKPPLKPVKHYYYGAKAGYYHTIKPYVKPTDTALKQPAAPIAAPAIADHSLNGQYNELLKKTYRYQQPPITALYKNYMDTLNAERRKLKEAQTKLTAQTQTIAGLQGEVSTKDQTLSASQDKVEQVSFLGMGVSKTAYNFIMWGLIIILGGALAAVILLSGNNRREAAYRVKLYDDLSNEFQTYKIKANEKEKKLARDLQTERNKLDDLLKK